MGFQSHRRVVAFIGLCGVTIVLLVAQHQNLLGYVTVHSSQLQKSNFARPSDAPELATSSIALGSRKAASVFSHYTEPDALPVERRVLNLSEEKLKWNLTLPSHAFQLDPNPKLKHDPYYLDPLRSPLLLPNRTGVKKLPLKPRTEYLGVLLDAGRQYFPVWWIERLIDYLHLLNFNLIHFRLTDDQAFNVRLDCHPELAQPSSVSGYGVVYSTQELRHLVKYAHERGVILMPEINVPGHAGAWSGVPGLLVPCAEFICEKGYGVPINVTHPSTMTVIKNVIREVRDIFHTSPYLHLGGDELEMILPCFREVGAKPFDYNAFERELQQVLVDLRVPLDKVMRWEMTGSPINGEMIRAGGMQHNWISHKLMKTKDGKTAPFFISAGLYFDVDQNADVFHNYRNTQQLLNLPKKPDAIVAGAFELGTDTWFMRSIINRLLTVSIGASHEKMASSDEVKRQYQDLCLNALRFPKELCELDGRPVPDHTLAAYKPMWTEHWASWRGSICDRLSVTHQARVFKSSSGRAGQLLKDRAMKQSSDLFWESLGGVSDVDDDSAQERKHAIEYSGIILDLVEEKAVDSVSSIKSVIDKMSTLGFNLLQLRVMSDMGFALKTNKLQHLMDTRGPQYGESEIQQLVAYAKERGVHVMPEISVTSRGGGWYQTQALVPCTDLVCTKGIGVALDLADASLFAHISAVVLELRRLFSSKFLHLGYDERKESMACYHEVNITDPPIDRFEHKLSMLLDLQDIPLDHVIRWENVEGRNYEGRAGTGTHYRLTNGPERGAAANKIVFASNGLDFSTTSVDDLDAFMIYNNGISMAGASPTAVLAVVNVIDVESWKNLNIDGRLVALSMGLSQGDKLNESQFRDSYMLACESLEGANCDLFGKRNVETAWATGRAKARKDLLESTCSARIETKEVRLPGPELLGPN